MKKRREIQAHAFCGRRYGWEIHTTPGWRGQYDEALHEAVKRKVRDDLKPFDSV